LTRTLSKERLRLPYLSDDRYDELAAKADLDACPTCGATTILIRPGVEGWENGTFRFRGLEYECDCATQKLLYRHYLNANIGDQYMRLNWNDYDCKPVREKVKLYLDAWDTAKRNGMGMTFKGKLGTGKTFAATYIGKELIKRGEDVYFIPFLNVISSYQKQHAEEIDDRLKGTGVLILDELLPPESGAQAALFARRYEELIRHRTNFNLPTIVTTNLTEDELLKEYPRTYSLLAPKQVAVEVTQTDDARRGKIAMENEELLANREVRPIT
jgi:DNA replication protein DnaC